jgi:hypothetical protein
VPVMGLRAGEGDWGDGGLWKFRGATCTVMMSSLLCFWLSQKQYEQDPEADGCSRVV